MDELLIELLHQAIEKRATDIHFKVDKNKVQVSFRVRQKMVEVDTKFSSVRLFRYLQYRANLDVSEILIPQTGQFEIEINERTVSLRFAVLHSFSVVSGVLRILNAQHHLQISDLTFSKKQTLLLKRMIQRKNGLILLSGPTGSGKTTTLYTLLHSISDRKIYTIEDPIEVYYEHFVQLQVNEKQNFTYKEGIKQLLRHDPDIIVIGEIRDEGAAQSALRSALTGHLVISTIHAFDCASAIERMIELEVPLRQLQDVLIYVSNQRLFNRKNRKERIGVYEIMEQFQIHEYLQKGVVNDFSTISMEIDEGIQKGFLAASQANLDKT